MKRVPILLLILSFSLVAEEDAFDRAGRYQQQSISHLCLAMKDTIKLIALTEEKMEGGAGEEKQEFPFKDKQKYYPPKLEKKNSPSENLSEMLQEQNEVAKGVEELKDSPKPGEPRKQAGKKQDLNEKTETAKMPGGTQKNPQEAMQQLAGKEGNISDKARNMSEKSQVSESVKDTVSKVAEAAQDAADALNEGETEEAMIGAARTEAGIQRAMDKLRELSMQAKAEALATARKSLNESRRRAAFSENEEANKQAWNAINKLARDAEKLSREGDLKKAEELAELTDAMCERQL